jgi:hypothetical protein
MVGIRGGGPMSSGDLDQARRDVLASRGRVEKSQLVALLDGAGLVRADDGSPVLENFAEAALIYLMWHHVSGDDAIGVIMARWPSLAAVYEGGPGGSVGNRGGSS